MSTNPHFTDGHTEATRGSCHSADPEWRWIMLVRDALATPPDERTTEQLAVLAAEYEIATEDMEASAAWLDTEGTDNG